MGRVHFQRLVVVVVVGQKDGFSRPTVFTFDTHVGGEPCPAVQTSHIGEEWIGPLGLGRFDECFKGQALEQRFHTGRVHLRCTGINRGGWYVVALQHGSFLGRVDHRRCVVVHVFVFVVWSLLSLGVKDAGCIWMCTRRFENGGLGVWAKSERHSIMSPSWR